MSEELIKMYHFIINNEELLNYFKKVASAKPMVARKKEDELLDIVQVYGEQFVKQREVVESKLEKLESLGIKVEEDSKFFIEGNSFDYVEDSKDAYHEKGHYEVTDNYEYHGYHDYEWINEDREYYPLTFNGKHLTIEKLEDEINNNSSTVRYNKWKEEHTDLEEKLMELSKSLDEDLEKLQHKLFGREKLKERIEERKSELARLVSIKNQGTLLKEEKDYFDKLSSEDKENILDYLKSVKELNRISVEGSNLMLTINSEYYRLNYDRVDTNTLIEESLAQGIVSEEEKETVDYILTEIDLSNVIIDDESHYRRYGFDRPNESTGNLISDYCKMIFAKRLNRDYESLKKNKTLKK